MAQETKSFVLRRGPSDRLSGLAVQDGALIITTDKHQLFADIGTERYNLGDYIDVASLPTENINDAKYYFLTVDKCIYRHLNGEWVNVSRSGFTITTGKTNGTISVNGVDVAVFGLGSAAFTESTAYDAAGSAKAVQGETDKTVADAIAAAQDAQDSADDANDAIAALKPIASSGAASDVSVADTGELVDATNVEAAIAELATKLNTASDNGKVTVAESASDDYAKVYTFTQAGSTIGTINIPKDMVLSTGTVVTLDEADEAGHAKGTYLKLVLANAENSELWIPVDALIEYVTGGATNEVTVTVDPVTHVVTATLNDGSITKSKLDTGVQGSLNKADTAVQSVTVLGSDLKDGDELTADAAKTALGLGSAAYTDSTAYDAAGSAATAEANANGYTDTKLSEALAWVEF